MQMKIPIDQLIRSRRKTIALEISVDSRLIVRAPLFVSDRAINRIVYQKRSWIIKKQNEAKEKRISTPLRKFAEGERLPFLGNDHPLHIIAQSDSPLGFDGQQFLLNRKFLDAAEKMFESWYRHQAIRIFHERVSRYAPASGVTPDSLKLSNAGKRWGSCSARGNIRLNWRLVMASLEIIDYVVVHELTHIRERNHSKKFWALVRKILPEFRKQQIWLKKNGHLLNISGFRT